MTINSYHVIKQQYPISSVVNVTNYICLTVLHVLLLLLTLDLVPQLIVQSIKVILECIKYDLYMVTIARMYVLIE